MFRKLTLAAAAGAGYVLGAKAGKERYDQIEAKFREIAGMPAVQNATATVKETASSVADTAKTTVTEKVGGATDSGSTSGTTSGIGTAGTTGTGTGGGFGTGTGASTAAPVETDVVVVDLGTGANTGATSPISGARASDTL